MMASNGFIPSNENEVILSSIISDLQVIFTKKLWGKPQTFTINLKLHEAIALKKYMQSVYNALPAASVDATIAYNTMNEIGKKTPTYHQKQLKQ